MMFLLNMVDYTHVYYYYVLPLTSHLQYLGPLIGGYLLYIYNNTEKDTLYNNTAKDYLIN